MPIPWHQHDHLLGKLSDSELARRIGCSKAAVGLRRQKLSIPPFAGRRNGYGRSVLLGPDGSHQACTWCGRSGVPHAGHGLCVACYRRDRRSRGLVRDRAEWAGRTCAGCGAVWDVPQRRRRGAPPRFCDGCRTAGRGEPLPLAGEAA